MEVVHACLWAVNGALIPLLFDIRAMGSVSR